jgi:quinol monooxygenase YgiN
MYARSTTIQARPENIDDGIAYVQNEVMQAMEGIDGCVGLSMLADRSSGRCIVTSSWRSEDAMRASDDQLRPMRERAAQTFGGPFTVDEWEIPVMHRDHPTHEGACARVSWLRAEGMDIDRAIDTFRMGVMPMAEQLPGWCSASLFVDRSAGRACVTSTFDNREAMERSRQEADQLRARTAQEMGAQIEEVAEFELVMAHLRVPETA